MKKTHKRLLSSLAAAMMLLGTGTLVVKANDVPPQGEVEQDNSPTITINNTIKDATYKAYKIFDLALDESGQPLKAQLVSGSNEGLFTYLATSAQKKTFEGVSNCPFTFTAINPTSEQNAKFYVSTDQPSSVVISWLINNRNNLSLSEISQETAQEVTDSQGNKKVPPVKLSVDNYGYYLITETVGGTESGLAMIDTLSKSNLDIENKNKIEFNKKISDTVNQENVQIGDVVDYEITGDLYSGMNKYTFTDTMKNLKPIVKKGEGITHNTPAVIVKVNDVEISPNNYTITPYSESELETGDKNYTFTFELLPSYLNTIGKSTKIVVKYSGTVINEAYKNNDITNHAELTYGNNQSEKKSEDNTRNYLTTLTINKYEAGNTDKKLPGAQFELYKVLDNKSDEKIFIKEGPVHYLDKDGNKVSVTEETNKENLTKIVEYYYVDGNSDGPSVKIETAGENGTAVIRGLDKDYSYKLVETKAPDGYNKANSDFVFPLKDLTKENTAIVYVKSVDVPNGKGATLPSTGGMGTTMLYTAGGLLVVAAGVVLVVKKRMEA